MLIREKRTSIPIVRILHFREHICNRAAVHDCVFNCKYNICFRAKIRVCVMCYEVYLLFSAARVWHFLAASITFQEIREVAFERSWILLHCIGVMSLDFFEDLQLVCSLQPKESYFQLYRECKLNTLWCLVAAFPDKLMLISLLIKRCKCFKLVQ